MAFFPMYVNLSNQPCVIVGAGTVAYRKAAALLEFGAKLTVIAPHACEEMHTLEHKIIYHKRAYQPEDIKDAFLVIVATQDHELNHCIAIQAKNERIPVNVVDKPEDCSFIFPAYIMQEDIVIGITSGGKSPVLTQKIKERIHTVLPSFFGSLNHTLGAIRGRVKSRIHTEKERKIVYQKIIDAGIAKGYVTETEIEEILLQNRDGVTHE